MGEKSKFTVTKSYQDGNVRVGAVLKANDWHGDRIAVSGSADISAAGARELASALMQAADKADAKIAAKAAREARREKWRQQQKLRHPEYYTDAS